MRITNCPIAAVACVLAATADVHSLAAQQRDGRRPGTPRGVREMPGRVITTGNTTFLATATSDGLVELVVARDTSFTQFGPRERRVRRAFFPPGAVTAWIAAVDTLRTEVASATSIGSLRRLVVSLGGGDPVGVSGIAVEREGRRTVSLGFTGCGGGFVDGYVDVRGMTDAVFGSLVAALDTAAAVARRTPNVASSGAVGAETYFEHAVGCTAEPFASNPAPEYPVGVSAPRRRREVLTRFVVDTNGLVDPATIQMPPQTPPVFATAVRATLARWRFTKPTRRGIPVRQLSHHALVFEPSLGDPVEPGCARGARVSVLVRPLTTQGGTALDHAYLTHVAMQFHLWFETRRGQGSSMRFVVQRDGRLTDPIIDTPPTDADAHERLRQMVNALPFRLDPLPPTYPSAGVALRLDFVPECQSPRTGTFWGATTTFTPLPDGMVELANLRPYWANRDGAREPYPSRDVVTANALRRFLDTTQTLLPGRDGQFPAPLDRWSGSLAEVPIIGYRGNVGLILGLGTQGQLHGGISCGSGDESISFRLEDLPGFWRIGRDALAAAPRVPVVRDGRSRVYDESDVACAALPAISNPPIGYPSDIVGDERESHEALAMFVVDTLGRVEAGSVAAMPGSDSRYVAAVRQGVARWQFRPAMRGGRRVRQRLHMAFVLRPPEADAVAPSTPPTDPADRTIFFRRPSKPLR